ncbi:MAG: hypothetical protein L0I76_08485 [Pseudonocardia sp.]|nr:hypothetical protein [Pseudonocardia sp.]
MRTKLYAVPARGEANPVETGAGPAGAVPAEPASEQLATWARAVDESAAMSEDAVESLRALRSELLAGRDPDVQVLAMSLITQLLAAAYVLGETQAGLEELAHEFSGGAA